jgi:hypothetical protein
VAWALCLFAFRFAQLLLRQPTGKRDPKASDIPCHIHKIGQMYFNSSYCLSIMVAVLGYCNTYTVRKKAVFV